MIGAAPAESAADPPEDPPPAIPDWRAHLDRTPADVSEAAKCWARAFELRLGGPLAPNERPKLDEVAGYLWALADSMSRPWSAVARRALDALFADPRLRSGVRRPGGWAKAHMATIADLVTGDEPIPDALDLDGMREREASARRGRPGRDAYQRARMTPDLLEGPELGDEDIPIDPPRTVIPYGPGGTEEPGAPALAAWQAAIRAADRTPPPPTAADMQLHAEVVRLARQDVGGRGRRVEDLLEEWARTWYAAAKAPTARSWVSWARAAAAGKPWGKPDEGGYQRVQAPAHWQTGRLDFGDGDIPTDDAPRKVIPYGGGSSEPARSEEPGAMALAAWSAAIRAAGGTPPTASAEDMRHHAEVVTLARGQARGAGVEAVLEEWARGWYAWAKVPSAHSWLVWCRSAAAGKAPSPPRRSGFVEAGTDFTEWGDADIVAGGGS